MTNKSLGKKCLCLIVSVLLASMNHFANCRELNVDTCYHSDSVADDSYKFQFKQLILPATLVTVGSIGVCNSAFTRLNTMVRDEITDLRGNYYFRVDDYMQYLPVASYLGLGAVGVECRNSFKVRLMVGATAYLAMGIMVNTTKYLVKEKRPNSNARNSFPSGHTATVFMGAELIRQEYGTSFSVGAYVVAAGVGFLRIYNDRHWLNDVIAGAGIGILSARIGYWMLPLYQKWFQWNKSMKMLIVPKFDSGNKNIGIGIVALF